MAIPVIENIKVVDENGYFTAEWFSIMQSLFQTLQVRFSDEGLIMPSQTSANIALLTNPTNGTMVYNSTTNKANVSIAGAFKEIITT
jgi:hypothetical protein